jgi:hypothetical protein
VLEEVQRDFAPAVFAIALLASVVVDVTTRLLLGQTSSTSPYIAFLR